MGMDPALAQLTSKGKKTLAECFKLFDVIHRCLCCLCASPQSHLRLSCPMLCLAPRDAACSAACMNLKPWGLGCHAAQHCVNALSKFFHSSAE